jgi:ankyrin repeat protein
MRESKDEREGFFSPEKFKEMTEDMAGWLDQVSTFRRCSTPSVATSTFTTKLQSIHGDNTHESEDYLMSSNSRTKLKEHMSHAHPSRTQYPVTSDCANAAASSAASVHKTQKTRRRSTPGIILLIEQGNWKKVEERAKKYPNECKLTSYIKKGERTLPSQGIQTGMGSFRTIDTTETNRVSSLHTNEVERTSSSDSSVSYVKVKALHQACQRLRKVHSQITKLVAEQIEHRRTMAHDQSFQSGSSFDESEDGIGYTHAGCFSFSQSFETQEEWNDPWIEACMAILAILDAYPDAASMRESRHGCLPLHLAAFAMCPCPTVDLSQMEAPTSTRSSVPNDLLEELPPPRPLSMGQRRRPSASSLGSNTLNSLDDLSAMMSSVPSTGNYNYNNKTQTTSSFDLSSRLDAIESKLRNSTCKSLSLHDEDCILESARFLSRPASIASNTARDVSVGTIGTVTSTCSNSVVSKGSTVAASPMKHRNFDLRQYASNASKREEFSVKVLKALIRAFPKGVETDSEGGRLPLHFAISGQASLPVIDALIKVYPGAARHRAFDTSLPLHIAARSGVSDPRVISKLLDVYPDACLGKNKWERTPEEEALLAAGENGRPHQIDILQQLRKHRRAFYEVMSQQRLVQTKGNVVHSSTEQGHENSDVNLDLASLIKDRRWGLIMSRLGILQTQLQATHNVELRGGYYAECTALYLACEYDPPCEVLEAFISVCPHHAVIKTIPGDRLPLHALCTYGSSFNSICVLLNSNSNTVKQVDALGNLPLHSACYSGASVDIIESLLRIDPNTVEVPNKSNDTSRDIVQRLTHDNRGDVLSLIEETSLELLKKKRQYDSNKLKKQFEQERDTNKQKKSGIFRLFLEKKKKTSETKKNEDSVHSNPIDTTDGDVEIELADDAMLWL